MGDEWGVIERVTKRARSKAWFHAAISAGVTVMLLLTPGGPTLTAILVGMNVLAAVFLTRRALRLRPSGPVMTALRDRPQDIASIHEWPPARPGATTPKQPAKRPPAALEIRTHAGALASIFLDAKQPGESAALVAALRTRSPDAVVVYPAIHLA